MSEALAEFLIDHLTKTYGQSAVAEAFAPRPTELFRRTLKPSPDGRFITLDTDGVPVIHCHPKQYQLFESDERFVLALAGVRSGKTSPGPWWLIREIERCGPGFYILAAPSYPLLDKAAVPELRHAYERILKLGKIVGGASGSFVFSEDGHRRLWPNVPFEEPTRIIFGHADKPTSLAAVTAKAAWLDEVGVPDFKQESHEEIQARVSLHRGRILYTTRPYGFNWLKTEVYDRADRNRRGAIVAREAGEIFHSFPGDEGYAVVEYESIDNPMFSREEWERQQNILPKWKFDLIYRGRFTRPAGAVYDCFGRDTHVVPYDGFKLKNGWPILCGIDFGAPNFAAVFLYEEMIENEGPHNRKAGQWMPTGRYAAFAEYRPQVSHTAKEHIANMRRLLSQYIEPPEGAGKDWLAPNPTYCVGGAKSEGQWRSEFGHNGWPIMEPDQREVEVGIDRVYAMLRERNLMCYDSVPMLIEELESYAYKIDETGEPTNEIEDKAIWHGADSLRYICSWIKRTGVGTFIKVI